MNALLYTRDTQPLLRRAFALDAAATGGLGLLLAIGAEQLHPWLELPVMLLREAGIVCVIFAAWLGYALTRPMLTRAMAWFAVAVNAAWVLASFVLLASGWVQPTVAGSGFIVAQALAVVLFAELQYLGARRAFR